MADSNYIINKLVGLGVPSNDSTILAAVGYAESSYITGIIGDQQYGGSIGIFQINLPAHKDKLAKWTSSLDKNVWITWLSNLDNNIYAASQVYFSQGLGAWTMYRNKGYQKFLGLNKEVSFTSVASTQNTSKSPSTSASLESFVSFVKAQVGKPYVAGNEGPNSFDCSGLIYYVWNNFGIKIGRSTFDQWPECKEVSSLKIGNLVFSRFGEDGPGPGHVGIYVGDGKVVHASGSKTGVIEVKSSQFSQNSYRAASHPGMESYLYGSSSGDILSPIQNISIPSSSYQVQKDSESRKNILYGRKYRVIVSSIDGQTALDVSDLKVEFNCVKTIMEASYSDVTIYNLAPGSENILIQEGYLVYIEAGYEGEQYGLAFQGNVIQPIRYKEGGVTYKLSLVSMDSDTFLMSGTANFSIMRGQNSRSLIDNLMVKSTIPSNLGSISKNLSDSRLTRGKVFFGLARDYLRQIAQSENASFYLDDGSVNIIKAQDLPDGEIFYLTPGTGLIGVPSQQDFGATIKMLLNPRVKLGSFIHVDNSSIRNQQYQQGQPFYPLDQDGIYRVIKITHKGDTRGNLWYTEVETVTQAGADIPSMMRNGNTNMWNG